MVREAPFADPAAASKDTCVSETVSLTGLESPHALLVVGNSCFDLLALDFAHAGSRVESARKRAARNRSDAADSHPVRLQLPLL